MIKVRLLHFSFIDGRQPIYESCSIDHHLIVFAAKRTRVPFFPRQWIPLQYHLANETSKAVTVSHKWQSHTQRSSRKTGFFWTFDSKSLYKIHQCMELYMRKVLKNRKRLVASRYSLRSAPFAKYRFLNLHILHFCCITLFLV